MPNKIEYQSSGYNKFFTVAPGVWGLRDMFVNIYMVLNPFDGTWVLIDTGFKSSAPKIKKMAAHLFGNSKPSAIILTHGHFDHTGSVEQLAEEWKVPVYAHYLELPFLTGRSSYPPADPGAGGGLISLLSIFYPTSSADIWNYINVLPEDGVPGLPQWQIIHTPGHTPGHISLYRESDGVLIAGDAFVTTKAESVMSVLLQTKKVSGPPKYFTTDWAQARQSIKSLMKLEPEIVVTGHGRPMCGKKVRKDLHKLADRFYQMAVPKCGRYINEPAIFDANGVVYIPPNNINMRSLAIKILGVTFVTATAYLLLAQKQKKVRREKEALAYEVW